MHCKVHGGLRAVAMAAAAVALLAPAAQAQNVVACDFDIADDFGTFVWGRTIHLDGRAGAGSTEGSFYVVNGATAEGDLDRDGYGPTCNFTRLHVSAVTELVNVEDPTLAIPAQNVVVRNFPRSLPAGTSGEADVSVEVPRGTVAGRYIGQLFVRDSTNGAIPNSASEILNLDAIYIEIRVAADENLTLVDPDESIALDSLVIRGRAGSRAEGVFRIANTGNAPLTDVRISASDLRSESAVGLVIPADRIRFSIASFSSLAVNDTARVTVTVDIPRGLLNGRYRGTLFVQAQDAAPAQVPLILIVTSSRGILFANNPVRGAQGDIAQIAFNGDPGTAYRVGVFDMAGLLVFQQDGTVFAGVGATPATPGSGADFAVNVGWPLRNGRGEDVASGMYLVVVQSVVNGERQFAKDRLMVIR
ncbi:MAG TPA: hypothetical protein VNA89_03520 [Gemmatimonadaceae bacterium]|nr:hypothetical protein [Gemmatimonadaceae bacterium]